MMAGHGCFAEKEKKKRKEEEACWRLLLLGSWLVKRR